MGDDVPTLPWNQTLLRHRSKGRKAQTTRPLFLQKKFRGRSLLVASVGAVFLALSAVGTPASVLTTLTYDFTQSGYSNGSADGVLTGSFTGDLEPNGFITDVSSVTIQFQYNINNSKLFATKSVSFFSLDTASNELELVAPAGGKFKGGDLCINAPADDCGRARAGIDVGSFNLSPILGTFTTEDQPVLRLVQSVMSNPPPPTPPPSNIGGGPSPAVPEPSTWSMMVIGLATFGLAYWRRPSAPRASAVPRRKPA
jgi:hypothetical protein